MPPSADLLPVLIDLVTKTLSPRSIELLQQWRGPLGESAVQNVLSDQLGSSRQDVAIAAEPFPVAFQTAFVPDVAPVERAQALDELRDQAVPRLMQPGVLREVVEVGRSLSRSVGPAMLADLIDLLLDMERDLFSSAGDVTGIQDLRLIVVEAWALGMSPAIVTAPADCSIWSAGLSAPECHLRYSTNWSRASGPGVLPSSPMSAWLSAWRQ